MPTVTAPCVTESELSDAIDGIIWLQRARAEAKAAQPAALARYAAHEAARTARQAVAA